MKTTSAIGILLSTVTLYSCAPIAASSPKLAQQRRGDSGVSNSGKGTAVLRKHSSPVAVIVTSEKYEEYVKTLGDYKLEKIEENDAQLFELREKHSIQKIELASDLAQIEHVTIFVVDAPEKNLGKASDIKVKLVRIDKDHISLTIDGESEETWALIKKSLKRVTFAYRFELM